MFIAQSAAQAVKAKPAIKGTTVAAASTVTIPTHTVGDLIILFAYRRSTGAVPTKPGASGTVPAWTDIGSGFNGTEQNGSRTVQFVATAGNHTSGTWSDSSDLIAVVISGQNATPIGGAAESGASSSSEVVSPAASLAAPEGSSLLLHFGGHKDTVNSIAAAPSGYTRRATASSGLRVFLNTKDDTTSAPAVSQPITASAVGYRGQTVEVIPA